MHFSSSPCASTLCHLIYLLFFVCFDGRGLVFIPAESPSSWEPLCSPGFGGACLSRSIPRVPGTGFSCPVIRISIISLIKAGSCLGAFPPVRCTHLATDGTT